MDNQPKLITRQAAAEKAGVSPRTIDYWRRKQYLTTYKRRGHFVMVDEDELDAYLQASPEPVPGPAEEDMDSDQ